MPKARVDVTESAPKTKANRIIFSIFALAFIVFLFYLPSLLSTQKQDCVVTIPISEDGKSDYAVTYTPERCVDLEAADTEASRSQGLSGRESMADDTGMLFVFEQPEEQCIWMKDMNFSLDIVWVNAYKEITKIKRYVSPETYPETFCVGSTKYVIELNAGVSIKARLSVGQKLNL